MERDRRLERLNDLRHVLKVEHHSHQEHRIQASI